LQFLFARHYALDFSFFWALAFDALAISAIMVGGNDVTSIVSLGILL
jgi:hypothetical protein